MGRPRELNEAERAELLAHGFEPREVWVPNWDDTDFRDRLEKSCREIRESDRRTGMDRTLDAFLIDLWDDHA